MLDGAVRRLLRAAPFVSQAGPDQDPTTRDEASAYVLGRRGDDWVVHETRPLPDLLGWRAPRTAWAVVMVATGSARSLETRVLETRVLEIRPAGCDAPAGIGRPFTGSGPVAVAVGVARSGEAVGRLRLEGGRARRGDAACQPEPAGAEEVCTPEGGRLLDTLMRTLDLPTPAPPEDTARFLALAWLAALVTASPAPDPQPRPSPGRSSPAPDPQPMSGSAETPRPPEGSALGWPAVVRCHPAARLLLARRERLRTAELERVVAAAQTTWTWDVLRRAETCNPSIVPLCPAGTAAWMDTGMYARWVLDELPAAGPLWQRAMTLVTPTARRRLRRWLEPAGVPGEEATPPPGRRGQERPGETPSRQ